MERVMGHRASQQNWSEEALVAGTGGPSGFHHGKRRERVMGHRAWPWGAQARMCMWQFSFVCSARLGAAVLRVVGMRFGGIWWIGEEPFRRSSTQPPR